MERPVRDTAPLLAGVLGFPSHWDHDMNALFYYTVPPDSTTTTATIGPVAGDPLLLDDSYLAAAPAFYADPDTHPHTDWSMPGLAAGSQAQSVLPNYQHFDLGPRAIYEIGGACHDAAWNQQENPFVDHAGLWHDPGALHPAITTTYTATTVTTTTTAAAATPPSATMTSSTDTTPAHTSGPPSFVVADCNPSTGAGQPAENVCLAEPQRDASCPPPAPAQVSPRHAPPEPSPPPTKKRRGPIGRRRGGAMNGVRLVPQQQQQQQQQPQQLREKKKRSRLAGRSGRRKVSGAGRRKAVWLEAGTAEDRAVKREQILESNRLASKKCRQRHKTREDVLEAQGRALMSANRNLARQADELREQLLGLKTEIIAHGSVCEDASIREYLMDASAQLVEKTRLRLEMGDSPTRTKS